MSARQERERCVGCSKLTKDRGDKCGDSILITCAQVSCYWWFGQRLNKHFFNAYHVTGTKRPFYLIFFKKNFGVTREFPK